MTRYSLSFNIYRVNIHSTFHGVTDPCGPGLPLDRGFEITLSRTPLDNLVNKANLVHNFLVCLFLFSTCFGRLCAHHQEKQLYLRWMTVWYAGCIQDSHPYRVTRTKCGINTVVSPDDGHLIARNM